MEMRGGLEHRYLAFVQEAEDSPCLSGWAEGVVADREVQAWIAQLPALKQQPNLVFAAARWHGAEAPGPYAGFREVLLERSELVRDTICSRSTQTNEVGRLASLVPVLARLSEAAGPLALIEVGASAGLCLYPDRYDYRWTGAGSLEGSGGPLLMSTSQGRLPVPVAHPRVAWRGGCDLNPLDVHDEESMAWLQNLVWPEHEDRRTRLRQAVEIARAEAPVLVPGDLLHELPGLLAEAGRHGQPVVFHSAVIAYLDDHERQTFQHQMNTLSARGDCHWVSNEGPQVLPDLTDTLPEEAKSMSGFVLAVDGAAVARTHPHGAWIDWMGPT